MPEDQKSVYEQLSERRNIVVIADEAHRTQYGSFEASIKEVKDKETKEKLESVLLMALPNICVMLCQMPLI